MDKHVVAPDQMLIANIVQPLLLFDGAGAMVGDHENPSQTIVWQRRGNQVRAALTPLLAPLPGSRGDVRLILEIELLDEATPLAQVYDVRNPERMRTNVLGDQALRFGLSLAQRIHGHLIVRRQQLN